LAIVYYYFLTRDKNSWWHKSYRVTENAVDVLLAGGQTGNYHELKRCRCSGTKKEHSQVPPDSAERHY